VKHTQALDAAVVALFVDYPLLSAVLALAPAGVVAPYWLDAMRAITTTYCKQSMAKALRLNNGTGHELRALLALIGKVSPGADTLLVATGARLTPAISARLVALRNAAPTHESQRNILLQSSLFVTLNQARLDDLRATIAADANSSSIVASTAVVANSSASAATSTSASSATPALATATNNQNIQASQSDENA